MLLWFLLLAGPAAADDPGKGSGQSELLISYFPRVHVYCRARCCKIVTRYGSITETAFALM